MSSGAMSGISQSSGLPMFPPRWTRCPAALSSSAMMELVVVLPSEPVMPIVRQGQLEKGFHLAGYDRAVGPGVGEMRVVRQQARRAEDNVKAAERVEIPGPEAQLGAAGSKVLRLVGQRGLLPHVADGYGQAVIQKQIY